jgi:hypothetical protein
MSPLYDICETCGHLVPLGKGGDRCPVCTTRLYAPVEDEPDVGRGVSVGMMLAAMCGGLGGAAITLLVAC